MLVLGTLTAVTFANSCQSGLVLDNKAIIGKDWRITEITRANLKYIFTENYWYPNLASDLYRPLTTLTYLFNYTILRNELNPVGYHIVNILLHALNALLAFALFQRLLRRPWAALAAAAIFAVHPLTTESVTNIVGRADLLATASVLTALLLHARGLEARRLRFWEPLGIALVTLAGVFCKESAVVIVALMPLYDFSFPPGGTARPVWRRLWQRFRDVGWLHYAALAPAVVSLLLARKLLLYYSPVYGQIAVDNPLVLTDFWTARMTAVKVLGHYLAMLFWPATLSCDYSYNQIRLFGWTLTGDGDWQAWVSLIVLVALGVVTWRARRRNPPLFFLLMFAAVAMLPTSNLVIYYGSIMAERTLYMPLVGLTGALAAMVLRTATLLGRRGIAMPRLARPVAALALAVLLAALAVRSHVRNRDWRDELSLWQSAIDACPDSHKVYKGMAEAMSKEQPRKATMEEVVAMVERGLAVFDKHPLPLEHEPIQLLTDVGIYYLMMGDDLALRAGVKPGQVNFDSIPWYEKSRNILERSARADKRVNELARQAQLSRGRPAEEIYDVGNPEIYRVLGTAMMRLRQYGPALEAISYQRRLDPANSEAYLLLGVCSMQIERYEEAAIRIIQSRLLGNEHPESATLLQAIYGGLVPGAPIVSGGGAQMSLNVNYPIVRRHMDEACRDMVGFLLEVKRFGAAEQMKSKCIEQFACDEVLFESLPWPLWARQKKK